MNLLGLQSIKEKHILQFLSNAKGRAKRDSVPFDLTKEYLLSIATDSCPIFNTPFEWGVSGKGHGNAKFNGPTLDRILPELGYVEGNVAFISYRANRIKDNGTMKEHYAIADWIWNHIHAKQNTLAPVSTGHDSESQNNSEHGAIHGTRIGEDCDGSHHHLGSTEGDNPYSSTKESSRVSMDAGVSEMGASEAPQSGESDGLTEEQTECIRKFIKHLCDQSREFGVAVRAEQEFRLPNHRRELEVQGFVNEKVQSTEETLKTLQETLDSYWDTISSRITRSMEPSGHTGLRAKTGDEPNKI